MAKCRGHFVVARRSDAFNTAQLIKGTLNVCRHSQYLELYAKTPIICFDLFLARTQSSLRSVAVFYLRQMHGTYLEALLQNSGSYHRLLIFLLNYHTDRRD